MEVALDSPPVSARGARQFALGHGAVPLRKMSAACEYLAQPPFLVLGDGVYVREESTQGARTSSLILAEREHAAAPAGVSFAYGPLADPGLTWRDVDAFLVAELQATSERRRHARVGGAQPVLAALEVLTHVLTLRDTPLVLDPLSCAMLRCTSRVLSSLLGRAPRAGHAHYHIAPLVAAMSATLASPAPWQILLERVRRHRLVGEQLSPVSVYLAAVGGAGPGIVAVLRELHMDSPALPGCRAWCRLVRAAAAGMVRAGDVDAAHSLLLDAERRALRLFAPSIVAECLGMIAHGAMRAPEDEYTLFPELDAFPASVWARAHSRGARTLLDYVLTAPGRCDAVTRLLDLLVVAWRVHITTGALLGAVQTQRLALLVRYFTPSTAPNYDVPAMVHVVAALMQLNKLEHLRALVRLGKFGRDSPVVARIQATLGDAAHMTLPVLHLVPVECVKTAARDEMTLDGSSDGHLSDEVAVQ